jgi:thiol-disulfide isomerase/thioredoxin
VIFVKGEKMKNLLVFSSIIMMIFAVSCKKKQEEGKKSETSKGGVVLPAFSIEGLWGDKVSNSDIKDKVSIVEIWSYGCPHCIHQAKYFEELAKDLDFSKFAIVSIHGRGGNKVKGRVTPHFQNKKIKVALDDGSMIKAIKALPKKYHVRGIPHLMIVNKKGEIVEVLRGARKADVLKKLLAKY